MTGSSPPNDVMDAAFDWLAELNGGSPLTPDRRRAFERWLDARPGHAAAYAEARALWADLDWSEVLNAAAFVEAAPVAPPARPNRFRGAAGRRGWGKRMVMAAAIAASVVAGVVIVPELPRRVMDILLVPTVETATGVGEIRQIALSDGSQVTLGGRSSLRIRMGRYRRQVELVDGDAFFDVAHESKRPFMVEAGDLTATVVGTAFEVNRDSRRVQVAVTRGRVRAASDHEAAMLTPGQAARLRSDGSLAVLAFNPATAGRWRDQRATFRDVPLSQVVESLNRYHPGGVILMDPGLADLPVTAAFRFDQMEIALEALAAGNGLTVRKDAAGRLTIDRASGE